MTEPLPIAKSKDELHLLGGSGKGRGRARIRGVALAMVESAARAIGS